MTEKEKKIKFILFKGAEFMEAAEIPFMLGFGVLLNIIRDGKITTENDVDLMCLIEDLDIESENQSKQTISRYCLGSFCHFDIKYKDEVGPLDIFPLHKMGNIRYICMEKKRNLIWPAYHFDNPDTIKFFGRTWRIPSNPEKWFEIYYGKDWRTPKPDWSWETEAHNMISNAVKEPFKKDDFSKDV